jgi:hypothetical protein
MTKDFRNLLTAEDLEEMFGYSALSIKTNFNKTL